VPLWFERYILPICVAIVFGLTILNPLKLDWRQRVSLAIGVSAFAYFVAHTIHKPPSKNTQPEQRIEFLERQVESLQSQQQQLAADAKSKESEKQRRQAIRGQLGNFIAEGERIKNELQFNNSTALHQKVDWEQRVVQYLTKNLDESFAVRFRSPSHQVSSYPMGINRQMMAPWADVVAKMAMLDAFISELRD
jgi:hypothetical protein